MSWMVTPLYSDVASRPPPGRPAARLSVARLQSAGADSGLETKSTALGARTSPWIRTRRLHCCTAAAAAAAVSHKMEHKIPRQVGSSALATSLCRQTRGSQPWLGRLGPTRSAAHPARLFAAPDHNNSSWSRRLLESVHAQ